MSVWPLCAAFLAGCSPAVEPWRAAAPPPGSAVIVEAPSREWSPEARAILNRAFPGARRLTMDQLAVSGPVLRRDRVVLVAPPLRSMQNADWEVFADHLARGGRALFWGSDPAGREAVTSAVRMLRPNSEHFECRAPEIRGLDGGAYLAREPLRLQSPFPLPESARSGSTLRWIPIAEAREPDGPVRGWPASAVFEAGPSGAFGGWAWIAWEPDQRAAEAQAALLRRAVRLLRKPYLLVEAGTDRLAFSPGESIALSVRIAGMVETGASVRLTVEAVSEAGAVERRFTQILEVPGARPVPALISAKALLGAAPRTPSTGINWRIHSSLTDPGEEIEYDRLVQSIRIISGSAGSVDSGEPRMSIRGGSFVIGRRPVPLAGARFEPIFGDASVHPLEPPRFTARAAERELSLFQEAGLNIIELPYTRIEQAPQLRLLLDELHSRRMRAVLTMPSLSPWRTERRAAKALLDALALTRDSPVMAVLVPVGPPSPGDLAAENRLRSAWQDWIAEEYGPDGDPEWAESIDPLEIARKPERMADLAENSQRDLGRFFHDAVGRELRRIRRELSECGIAWLGAEGCEQYPQLAGIHHVDFVVLSNRYGESFPPGWIEFLTAYARGASGGKPVIWRIHPSSSGDSSDGEAAKSAERIGEFLQRVEATHVAGVLAGPLTGGRRGSNERSAGLLNPDGSWNPAGDRWRVHLNQWRRKAPVTAVQWRSEEADPLLHRAWEEWRTAFAKVQSVDIPIEIRPRGWGRSSEEVDSAETLRGLLNADWMNPIPPPTGEAIPVRLRQPVSLELLNTGPAAWAGSERKASAGVWLRATPSTGRTRWISIPDTPPGGRVKASWVPPDPGLWTLRLWTQAIGEFGESLRVAVLDEVADDVSAGPDPAR
ncbi:MAG: hypothetical protein NZ740_01035 [Kiritimatiellae bacterium]|nr:hypothetical protein [Kiritimatiellia bacterium]MDW8457675.1 hypothetical protein [Verrucomicrobiota bacterium]